MTSFLTKDNWDKGKIYCSEKMHKCHSGSESFHDKYIYIDILSSSLRKFWPTEIINKIELTLSILKNI